MHSLRPACHTLVALKCKRIAQVFQISCFYRASASYSVVCNQRRYSNAPKYGVHNTKHAMCAAVSLAIVTVSNALPLPFTNHAAVDKHSIALFSVIGNAMLYSPSCVSYTPLPSSPPNPTDARARRYCKNSPSPNVSEKSSRSHCRSAQRRVISSTSCSLSTPAYKILSPIIPHR